MFEFTLFGDFAYSVEARDFIDEIEARSQRIRIPEGNIATLKLVVRPIKQLSNR